MFGTLWLYLFVFLGLLGLVCAVCAVIFIGINKRDDGALSAEDYWRDAP